MRVLTLCMIVAFSSVCLAQDNPEVIAKKELPKAAECVICTSQGEGHEEEKPVAGVKYKGQSYYFCNSKEVALFKKNPDLYLPLTMPMVLPDLGLVDTTGKAWNAEAFKEKVVLIDYWASWCKPCHELKPKLDKIREANKAQGFEVLSINTDQDKVAFDKFMSKNKFANPVARDEKGKWTDLKVTGIPALFLVADGKIVAQYKGKIDIAAVEKAVKTQIEICCEP